MARTTPGVLYISLMAPVIAYSSLRQLSDHNTVVT